MDRARLEQLGLTVRDSQVGPEAELDLQAQLVNPLTRQFLDKVVFAVVEERLVAIEPPEFIGLPPINLGTVTRHSEIESQLADAFTENILQAQRRSKELQAIGISPRMDPKTLVLGAELDAHGYRFTIQADKRGSFRLVKGTRDGEALQLSGSDSFELSEFRDQRALTGYLMAMVGAALPAEPEPVIPPNPTPITFGQIVRSFGSAAVIPPTSHVELVIPILVDGVQYRFAAARVAGDSFRGLLAGPKGKVWAERFELSTFPGVVATVARALGVDERAVQLVGEGK